MHCKYFTLSHALEYFSKALYGTTEDTYSAHVFRPVMVKVKIAKRASGVMTQTRFRQKNWNGG